MAKRFTPREDRYICEFFDVAGAANIAGDLGRTEAGIKARAKKLREAGAFDIYRQEHEAAVRFNVAAGHMTADDAALIHDIEV